MSKKHEATLNLPLERLKSSSSLISNTFSPGAGIRHALLKTQCLLPKDTTTSFFVVNRDILPTFPSTFQNKVKKE